jgi:hypothetical protein
MRSTVTRFQARQAEKPLRVRQLMASKGQINFKRLRASAVMAARSFTRNAARTYAMVADNGN